MTTLSKCCVSGHLHKGTPQGIIKEYAGLKTYITGDNKAESLIMITVGHFYGVADHLLMPRYRMSTELIYLYFVESFYEFNSSLTVYLKNVKTLADEYASAGQFRVLVPDFFKGAPV